MNSKTIESGIYLITTFSPEFLNLANGIAKNLNLKTAFVVERFALAHLAERAAESELAGGTIPRTMLELAPGLDAEAFYTHWKSEKIRQVKPAITQDNEMFTHLSDEVRTPLEKAYKEALANPSKGREILQNAVDRIKQNKTT